MMLRMAYIALCIAMAMPARTQAAAEKSTLWAPLDSHARILAFGDSLTDGVGGSGETYPKRLSQLIGREVISSGVPGETTAEGRRRLPATLDRERPALLILCLGINDLLRGVDDATIRDHLVAMIRLATDRGVPTLLLAVPQPGHAMAHPLYAQVAEASGARLDVRAMVDVLANPALKTGLVHPNREGYRALAESLALRLHQEQLVHGR